MRYILWDVCFQCYPTFILYSYNTYVPDSLLYRESGTGIVYLSPIDISHAYLCMASWITSMITESVRLPHGTFDAPCTVQRPFITVLKLLAQLSIWLGPLSTSVPILAAQRPTSIPPLELYLWPATSTHLDYDLVNCSSMDRATGATGT